jgi:exopolysaccharide production protein ExoZ
MMRAIAALLVFLFHSLSLSATYSNNAEMRTLYTIWSHIGPAGVDIFFVISGFIMFNISYRDMGKIQSDGRLRLGMSFLVRRAARIYPLYWITLAVMILTPAWWDNQWHLLVLDRLAELHKYPMSLLLWGQPSFDLVAWTLVYEMLFYITITILMLVGGTQFGRAFFLWCCFQTGFVVAAIIGVFPMYPIANPITLEFILGVSLAYLISREINGYPIVSLLVGSLTLIASLTILEDRIITSVPLLRVGGYALPSAMILYGIISLEVKSRIRIPRPLVLCGDISYSIYLWHIALLILLGFVWTHLDLFASRSGCFAYIATGIALTLLISAFSYHLIERPVMKVALDYHGFFLERLLLSCRTMRGWVRLYRNPVLEN